MSALTVLTSSIQDVVATELVGLHRSLSSISSVGSGTHEDEKTEMDAEEDVAWSEVYKGDITLAHLQEMAHSLGLIQLCWDDIHFDFGKRSQFPGSYWSNTNKEKILLWYTDNFRRQFHFHFPKRRPLLLVCTNECGIQKMVCTTIRPTCLRYPELQHWQGCASFVSDHIKYLTAENPTALPEALSSPGEVLLRQSGHSFELATILASILIGAAYNAFVVSGFASREICSNDVTRSDCPYLLPEDKEVQQTTPATCSKYDLEPPRDLRSQFLLDMERKDREKDAAAKNAQAHAELMAIQEFEKPAPDPLHTHRRHGWVLILPSKDVQSPLFIEPCSGVAYTTNNSEFHGVDSVWNHKNYWIPVGNKRIISCKCLKYDLDNLRHWEHLLLGEPNIKMTITGAKPADTSSESALIKLEKHLDMPSSWVSPIDIPNSDYSRRYVDCLKTLKYRKCIAELFSPYTDAAGLTCRVTYYNNYECTDVKEVRESFANRVDLMYFSSCVSKNIHHRFNRGRSDALKEYWYREVNDKISDDLQFEFFHQAQKDSLAFLTMTSNFLREIFENRSDFLTLREATYGSLSEEAGERPILKIEEKYSRNKSIPASDAISRIEYNLFEEKVRINYHYDADCISSASRELSLKEMTQIISYEPSPLKPASKPLAIYHWLQTAAHGAQVAIQNVRKREIEVQELLNCRSRELATPELSISPFDEERNQEARERYKERDRKIREADEEYIRMEVDLLAPYISKLSIVDFPLPCEIALGIYSECLNEWKTILLARAIDIQKQFDQLRFELDQYIEEHNDDEGQHLKHLRFKLHCLQLRLDRHKELAPQRYLALESCLRSDSRLAAAF